MVKATDMLMWDLLAYVYGFPQLSDGNYWTGIRMSWVCTVLRGESSPSNPRQDGMWWQGRLWPVASLAKPRLQLQTVVHSATLASTYTRTLSSKADRTASLALYYCERKRDIKWKNN